MTDREKAARTAGQCLESRLEEPDPSDFDSLTDLLLAERAAGREEGIFAALEELPVPFAPGVAEARLRILALLGPQTLASDRCPKGHRQLWLGDRWEPCRTCTREENGDV